MTSAAQHHASTITWQRFRPSHGFPRQLTGNAGTPYLLPLFNGNSLWPVLGKLAVSLALGPSPGLVHLLFALTLLVHKTTPLNISC